MQTMMKTQRPALVQRQQLSTPLRLSTVSRSVAVRYQVDDQKTGPSTKLSPEEQKKVENIGADGSKLSPENAEKRADLGASFTNVGELQAFDGPAPETINSRLAMLGVVIALVYEARTGLGIREQIADHPFIVIGTFVLFSAASYIPILKGYTRKEAFSNGVWTPKAENWNGRIAQLGFLGMVITEAVSKTNTLQAWGLDKLFQ
jgi:hypothetical protein